MNHGHYIEGPPYVQWQVPRFCGRFSTGRCELASKTAENLREDLNARITTPTLYWRAPWNACQVQREGFGGSTTNVDDTCLRRCRQKRRTAFSRLGDDSRTLHSQYRIESQGGRGCGIEDDRALVSGERRDVSSSSRRRRREERHRNIATIRIINTTVLIK